MKQLILTPALTLASDNFFTVSTPEDRALLQHLTGEFIGDQYFYLSPTDLEYLPAIAAVHGIEIVIQPKKETL